MLNKPKGYVTTRRDIYGNKTVMELVDVEERVYPVGRLDKDTTGLLILTNDGEFANRVMHPRYEIQKTYVATLDRIFDKKDLAEFNRGIRLEEGTVHAKLKILSPRRIEVTLHQGYNHVVKRIFRKKGYWVADLHRVKIGSLSLDVPPASYRVLSQKEISSLAPPPKR
jgi:23S rRNA pseudouridine2605 synthase